MNNNVVQPVQKKTNGLCIAGLICSFIVPLVGLILSLVGMSQAKKKNEEGFALAVVGIIMGVIGTIVSTIIILFLIFSVNVFTSVGNNVVLQTACSNLDSKGYYRDPEGIVKCEDYVCTYKDGKTTYTKTCGVRYGQ